MSTPRPPAHLSKQSRRLWRRFQATYEFEEHHLRVLLLVCEALDQAAAAQVIIGSAGLIVEDRFGQPKPHPAVAVKRDAEAAAARLLSELNLGLGPQLILPED